MSGGCRTRLRLDTSEDLVVATSNGKQLRSSPSDPDSPACNENCYAAHFAVPADWYAVGFDDSDWPNAATYTEREVGVDNKNAYTNFLDTFRQGHFIWNGNLKLDNEVLLRRRVEK